MKYLCLVFSIVVLLAVPAYAEDGLSAKRFDELHTPVLAPTYKASHIEWFTSVPEAVAASESTGKPLLMWAMQGNPLGGT